MLTEFRLDRRGVRELLRGEEVRKLVDGVAVDIQARVRARVPPGTPVSLNRYNTDRGAASITIVHIQAMAWQARDGVLTRAAGEVGVEVREWGAAR